MEIKAYADASVEWIMKPPKNPSQPGEVSSGIATKVRIAAWRENDCQAIIREVNPRGIGQFEIVSNAEIDAILMAFNLLEANTIFTDSAVACSLLKNLLPIQLQKLSRKSIYMKITDFLTKKCCCGEGYIVLNSPYPGRNWIDFIKENDE